ncbi:hypothetical protein RvY_10217 [Ramazzottius varieornatus]|uniref:Phospholipid/glycerol acyltransferase domain-containing protein n=1 Tax=Ramazzottius varieornatus TaxID=947166 RepID=A0A1D1VC13_RAMVA|nr:hypothetical protein RvY_10217 [Ramazzottius varieornatus]
MPFRVVSIVLPSKVFGEVDDMMWGTYQRLVLFFFEKLSPVEVLFYGDIEDVLNRKESVLYISNHQSTVDWVVADMLAVRQGNLGQMRYILKDGLRFLPLYGYYFYQHDCIYVRRSRKFNTDLMMRNLEDIMKRRKQTWMIIFPEGTRFNPNNPEALTSSQEYAKKEGLPALQHVLSPRTKAFFLSRMALQNHFNAVYDITVLYSQAFQELSDTGLAERRVAPTMNDYLHGWDEQLHVVVNRTDLEDLPTNEKATQEWLYQSFHQKDRIIKNYIRDKKSLGTGKRISLSWSEVLPAALFFTGLNAVFWSTETGRKVYAISGIGGSLFTVLWMGMRKVA